jgi:peptide/nickel transport system permease protein
LPGNVGRAVLGPFATQESVDALNEQLGTNRSLFSQYIDWVQGLLHGDLGTSLTKQVPAWDVLWPALQNSFKLAFVAFVILVPISILGGVIAGLRYGRPTDKGITMFGLSVSAMPDFVTGIVLILVFAVWLGWLPVTAQAEPGANLLVQVKYLLLPAFTLTLVLFGYIARVTRAGMIEAFDSDYARTAYLKGLPSSQVVRKHVLRNALLPTIAVIAVQCGYLVGGLVAVEYLFNYQGLGALTLEAARQKDLPLLTAGVLVIGIVYLVVTLIADILYAFLNPRIRFGDDTA